MSISRILQSSSTTFVLSWNSLEGEGITYTVCYSANSGTQSDPPSGADCGTSGLTGTSTTLGSLSSGTTYYIWVRAESGNERGPYSDRVQERTYAGGRSWTPIDHTYISSRTANSRLQEFLYPIKFNIVIKSTSQFQSFTTCICTSLVMIQFVSRYYSWYRISITPDHHSHIAHNNHFHITHCHHCHLTQSPFPHHTLSPLSHHTLSPLSHYLQISSSHTKYDIEGTDPNSNFIPHLTFLHSQSQIQFPVSFYSQPELERAGFSWQLLGLAHTAISKSQDTKVTTELGPQGAGEDTSPPKPPNKCTRTSCTEPTTKSE